MKAKKEENYLQKKKKKKKKTMVGYRVYGGWLVGWLASIYNNSQERERERERERDSESYTYIIDKKWSRNQRRMLILLLLDAVLCADFTARQTDE